VEHTHRGLRGALPAPVFVAVSSEGWWALSASTTGTRNIGALLLLPVGTTYHGTPKQYSDVSVRIGCLRLQTRVLLSHGSQQNTCIIATCKVDVNMLSCDYGQTYDQTHNGSLGTARQGSYRDDQATLWVPVRCGSNTVGDQDGSQAGGSPFHPTPTRNAASIPVTLRQGFYAAV